MAIIIPADNHSVGDANHTPDHNNVNDVLGLLAQVLALGSGGGLVAGSNSAALAILQTMLTSWGGTPGQVFTSQGAGASPKWTTPAGGSTTLPFTVIPPSGDVTGATDATNINAALTAFFNAGTGGMVFLGPGDYYTNAQITVPLQVGTTTALYSCSLIGCPGATVIHQLSATGIFAHRTQMWGPVQNNQPNPMGDAGRIAGFILDGASAPSGAVGLDVGDAWGLVVDCCIKNFQTANAIGMWQINRTNWTEKCQFRLTTINCTNHVVIDSLGSASVSHEYNLYDLYIYMHGPGHTTLNAGQSGVTFQNGAFMGGGRFYLRGNAGGGGGGVLPPCIVFTVTGSDGSGNWSQLYNTEFDVVVESNASTNLPQLVLLGNMNNAVSGHGQVVAQFNNWVPSVLNGGLFAVRGRVHNDPSLTTPPALTLGATGVAVTYAGPDCMMMVSGGTVTQIKINGVVTGVTSGGPFSLTKDATYSITYTVAPTLTALPVNN
jgi:hypothetical protein